VVTKFLIIVGALCVGLAHAQVAKPRPVLELCKLIRKGDTAALEELVARKAFPAEEISYIASGTLFVGMSEGAALCALGPASKVNSTTGSFGTRLQVVYEKGRYRYVYIDDRKVSSWQE
jgi:hypothetical protein